MNISEKIMRAKEDYDRIYQMRENLIDGSVTEVYSEVIELSDSALSYKPNMVTVTLPNATDIRYMALGHNASLKNVNLPKAFTFSTYVFYQDIALEYVDLPAVDNIGSRLFDGCTALKCVNLHKVRYIGTNVFIDCTSLQALIFTNANKLTTLNNVNAFTNTPIESGTGFIYVPRNLIETYKTATNWTTYASQFRALEDYTVDGTIEGELDWDKVNGGTA